MDTGIKDISRYRGIGNNRLVLRHLCGYRRHIQPKSAGVGYMQCAVSNIGLIGGNTVISIARRIHYGHIAAVLYGQTAVRRVNISVGSIHVNIHCGMIDKHALGKENHSLCSDIHIYTADNNVIIVPIFPRQKEPRPLVAGNRHASAHIAIGNYTTGFYVIFPLQINR